jgi:lipoate-protein ligase A
VPDNVLRVLYGGVQSPLRSQTLWHAVASGVSAGEPPTLSFVRPGAPYVSIGYHRRMEELDLDWCRTNGLPVFRRMIGGGPVYLDPDQLFFQITVPASAGPGGAHAMRRLLEPAVAAYRDLGLDATFDDRGDITVEDAKISGIGGGRISDAAVAVGNLIERFDHEAATRILALDDLRARDETVRLMRRHVVPTRIDPEAFMSALVRRFAEALALTPREGRLSAREEARLAELDERFTEPEWLEGPAPRPSGPRRVKIRTGVWVFSTQAVGGAVVDDRLESVWVRDRFANGEAEAIERSLLGARWADAAGLARVHGEVGARVADELQTCGRTL